MKLILTILYIFFFSFAANCQNAFQPGYVVKYNNDTIRGYLENTTESNLFKTIKFKSELNGSPRIFSKADIISFSFSGDLFKTVVFLNTAEENPTRD